MEYITARIADGTACGTSDATRTRMTYIPNVVGDQLPYACVYIRLSVQFQSHASRLDFSNLFISVHRHGVRSSLFQFLSYILFTAFNACLSTYGSSSRVRSCNPGVNSAVHYQLCYWGIYLILHISITQDVPRGGYVDTSLAGAGFEPATFSFILSFSCQNIFQKNNP